MTTITDVLNQWQQYGVFSYVFPFLLIFAVIFAILEKTKLFGDSSAKDSQGKAANNVKGLNAIVAIAIAFLALQLDQVSTFFQVIFPKLGIGIAVLVVALILLGMFYKTDEDRKGLHWLGWILIAVVVLWSVSEWTTWFGTGLSGGLWYFLDQYLSTILIIGLVAFALWAVMKK